MKAKIIKELRKLEKKNDIKILFAVETGSRLWGIESKDSDYDIRFVYIRKKEDYLRINKLNDVFNHEQDNMDFVGFDIYKFSKLILCSNPNLIEWLKSNIVYLDDNETKDTFEDIITDHFNPLALYHHYRSMAKCNYLKYLKSGNLMTHKKYLYAMRGLINAMYVEKHQLIPSVEFDTTLALIRMQLPKMIRRKLMEIIEIKKKGKEKDRIDNIKSLDNYIERFLKKQTKVENRRFRDYSDIQKLIFKKLGVKKNE